MSRSCACVCGLAVTWRRSFVNSANVCAVSASERVVEIKFSLTSGFVATSRSESTATLREVAVRVNCPSSMSTFAESRFVVLASVSVSSRTFLPEAPRVSES